MANDNETHEEVCEEMRSFGNVPPPMFAWRDLAERAEAAHKRELAVKDAEIESMRRTVKYYEGVVSAKCKENESSRSLIKELADALECVISGFSREVVTYGGAFALVAKAREVVK